MLTSVPRAAASAPVAQLDRASASGAEGHRFESCRAYHLPFQPDSSTQHGYLTQGLRGNVPIESSSQSICPSLTEPPIARLNVLEMIIRAAAAAALPLAIVAVCRFTSIPPQSENAFDSFYHVAMADGFPARCLSRTFPYTTMSIWEQHFYDKELLFHAGIAAVRSLSRAIGMSAAPPFHLPALAFVGAFFWVFNLVSIRRRLPLTIVWTALLVILSPALFDRLGVLRPHLLGMTMMVAGSHILASISRSTQLWQAAALGYVMVFSYSQPHFVLIPAIIAALHWAAAHRTRFGVQIVMLTVFGLVAGMIIHPQFPNTVMLWKIQCVDVVAGIISGETTVALGQELAAPSPGWLMQNGLVFILAVLNFVLMYQTGGYRILYRCSRDTVIFTGTQAVFTAGLFLSMRCIEYAAPFGILALGAIVRDRLTKMAVRSPRTTKIQRRMVASGVVVALAIAATYYTSSHYRRGAVTIGSFGNWAGQNIPPGTKIANPYWSDFPMLFYSGVRYRYSWGLDPMFGYRRDPEAASKMALFANGKWTPSVDEMRHVTGARYMFISSYGKPRVDALPWAGARCVYHGSDGWLFDLRDDNQKSDR